MASSIFRRVVGILLFTRTANSRGWYEPVHHLARHHGLHVDTVWLQLCNTVRVLMVEVAAEKVVHSGAMKTLSLRHWAVLVCQ